MGSTELLDYYDHQSNLRSFSWSLYDRVGVISPFIYNVRTIGPPVIIL